MTNLNFNLNLPSIQKSTTVSQITMQSDLEKSNLALPIVSEHELCAYHIDSNLMHLIDWHGVTIQ